MWTTAYNNYNLKVLIELSTRCNAACPQCDRFKYGTLEPHSWLEMTTWTLNDFKTALPPAEIVHVKYLILSGLYGEPTTCKDLHNILRYVRNTSPNTVIFITTNGSTHNPEWWTELGNICGDKLRIQFDIDGITQEMHSTYRRNTNLQKVLNNMLAISKTPIEWAGVFTVVYHFNQDYLDEIKELTAQYGATHWDMIESSRYFKENGAVYKYRDRKGVEYELIQTDKKLQSYAPHNRKIRNYKLEDKLYNDKTHEVVCSAANDNRLQVDQYGNVWPCCYLITANNHSLPDLKTIELNKIKESGAMNLFKNTLGNILNSNWYTNTLKSDLKLCSTSHDACIKWCGRVKGSTDEKGL